MDSSSPRPQTPGNPCARTPPRQFETHARDIQNSCAVLLDPVSRLFSGVAAFGANESLGALWQMAGI